MTDPFAENRSSEPGTSMRAVALASACFVVVFVGAFFWFNRENSKPKKLILGKWEVTEPVKLAQKHIKVLHEFKADGTMIMTIVLYDTEHSITGKYSFIEDDVIEIEMEMDGSRETKREKGTVTKDSLELSPIPADPNKFITKLRRAG